MAFGVHVIKGGKPARAVKVSLGFTSAFQGRSQSQYTDVGGDATFESNPNGPAEIHINGMSFGLCDCRDGERVTLDLDFEDDELTDE